MSDDEILSGFLKVFHIPSQWKTNKNIKYLIDHRYIMDIVSTDSIKNSLALAGYLNSERMLYDYLYYMIQDILDKNGEIYITKDTLKYNRKLQILFNDTIPDFVIKSKYPRKTFILDICFSKYFDEFTKLKEKFKGLSYFTEFSIINKFNMDATLNFNGCKFLSNEDGKYLIQNFEIFEMSFRYWQACAKNEPIYWSDKQSIDIKKFKKISSDEKNLEFEQALNRYALTVSDRIDI